MLLRRKGAGTMSAARVASNRLLLLPRLHAAKSGCVAVRSLSSSSSSQGGGGKGKESSMVARMAAMVNFPDIIEHWSRDMFYKVGYGATAGAAFLTGVLGVNQETIIFDALIVGYWFQGYRDMNQTSHTILRNFPVLGNFRYLIETIRPEIRQYVISSDDEEMPFDRLHRTIAYQRAKSSPDTLPFGTRRDVYKVGYEWANHSMYPQAICHDGARVTIGGKDCKQPYAASILNISGMSYGALSDNAVLALSSAAKMGNFYHNTGEGGISKFHIDGGGDLVWNIGTGYFGCRDEKGNFSPERFKVAASNPQVKMLEIKLSQGAKPGHGGLLPGAKVTQFIAEARGVDIGVDCNSPPRHSAFNDAAGLVKFIQQLRVLSGGKPVGFKLCVGRPEEFCSLVAAMVQADVYPDFITIDGGEGGTGAAPPEFSNTIGTPLVEGLTFVHNVLVGAGVRDKLKLICSGKVVSGFSIVRNLSLGADVCNSARAMLFALGCIQALKCNTNRCPTGITTQDKELMKGLDVESKSVRVFNYHKKSVEYALDIVGAIGVKNPSEVNGSHLMKRLSGHEVKTFAALYPVPSSGCLLKNEGPEELQTAWNLGLAMNGGSSSSSIHNNKLPPSAAAVAKM